MRTCDRRRRRSGFTLIEVLVTLGIIALLVGLLLPAAQQSREAARRARCAAHLRQLITAVHHFESAHGAFPAATSYRDLGPRSGINASIYLDLLPYLEEVPLYQSLNLSIPFAYFPDFPAANTTAARTTIGVLLCPSDSDTWAAPYGCSSYRASVGLGDLRRDPARGPNHWTNAVEQWGAFNPVPWPLPVAEIRDGLANTLAFSEKKVGTGGDTFDPSRDWIDVQRMAETDEYLRICSSLHDTTNARTDAGRMWLFNGGAYTFFYASVPPNSPIPDCGTGNINGRGIFAARSYHPGGVNAALADGSVRWFASTISAEVWKSLGTRSRGDTTLID